MARLLRLIGVEFTRLRYRRAVLLLVAAAVVLPIVIAVSVIFDTRPPSDADRAEAERQVAQQLEDPFLRKELDRCIARPGRYGIPPELREDAADLRATCEEFTVPSVDDYLYTSELDLDGEREFGTGVAVVAILSTLMFLVGSTFIGHDWSTGSMSNQLLFESRRLLVFGSKALAVMSAALALSAVVLTAYWLGLYAVAGSRDIDLRSGTLLDCLQHGWRGAGVAAAAALGGFVLTNLFRSTVFSLGILFGVSVAGGLLLASIGPRDSGWLDPTINAQAVISDGTTYYVRIPERCYAGRDGFEDEDPSCDEDRTRSLEQGLAYYAILLGTVGALSAGSFRRRDVP